MSDYPRSRSHGRPPRTVGVRELKADATRIIRQVRESRATYVVTHRGEPVGVIAPISRERPALPVSESAGEAETWQAFLAAGRRIGRRFRADASGVDIVSRNRR